MDLCGQKIVGLSMSDRMTNELVINALNSAYLRGGRPSGVLLHSDYNEKYTSLKIGISYDKTAETTKILRLCFITLSKYYDEKTNQRTLYLQAKWPVNKVFFSILQKV
jgi:hypothetical protein